MSDADARGWSTERPGWMRYGGALATVVGTLGLALALRAMVELPDLEMLFLLPVMLSARWFGRGPALVVAALGVASYNFFFVPPLYTFSVADRRFLLTFLTMFAVGLVMSELTARLQREERRAASLYVRAKTEEVRSSLLSVVSHDLRTPLASITGAATVLLDEERFDRATRRELVGSIVGEAARLERLVANILDMTRLESGVAIKRDWVSLDEVIGGALTRLEERLAEREVTVDVPAEVPLLFADPVLLEQLFVNLLENADKYTPAGSPLEIHASTRAAAGDAEGGARPAVRIEVSDRGPGFAAGTEAALFERFVRGERAGGLGVGLGLSICRAIALAHDGSIVASSRAGGGATFTITLPTPSADEARPEALGEELPLRED